MIYTGQKLQEESFPFYNLLSESQIELLEEKYFEISYQKDEILCKQGAFAKQIMFVIKGKVKLFIENGISINILTLEPSGTFLGITTLFGSEIYPYSIVPFEDARIGLFDRDDFQKVCKQNAEFTCELLGQMNDYVKRSFDRLHCLTNKQMHGRFSDILICLKERIYLADSFEVELSRKELAKLTAMSAESLSRVIKEFNDQGIARIDGRSIEILDYERLQSISKTS